MHRHILYIALMTSLIACAGRTPIRSVENFDTANSFKYDNVLMEQNRLLIYIVFKKNVAIEGRITEVKVVQDKGLLFRLSDTGNESTEVWVSKFGQTQTMSFDVGDKIRVLGAPQESANLESVKHIVADKYMILGMCIANLELGHVTYHRPFRAECDNWEKGKLDQIRHLTSRLK